MSSIAVLAIWMTLGTVACWSSRRPEEQQLGWVPLAVVLGPMWFIVQSERAAAASMVSRSSAED